MQKLIKNMKSTKVKRKTTVVRFSPSAPAIAVGDNRGAVGIYIVRKPVAKLVADELLQLQQLRAALLGEGTDNRFDAAASPIASPMATKSPQKSHTPKLPNGDSPAAPAATEVREAAPTT